VNALTAAMAKSCFPGLSTAPVDTVNMNEDIA
jgi:hypothetical protein